MIPKREDLSEIQKLKIYFAVTAIKMGLAGISLSGILLAFFLWDLSLLLALLSVWVPLGTSGFLCYRLITKYQTMDLTLVLESRGGWNYWWTVWQEPIWVPLDSAEHIVNLLAECSTGDWTFSTIERKPNSIPFWIASSTDKSLILLSR